MSPRNTDGDKLGASKEETAEGLLDGLVNDDPNGSSDDINDGAKVTVTGVASVSELVGAIVTAIIGVGGVYGEGTIESDDDFVIEEGLPDREEL